LGQVETLFGLSYIDTYLDEIRAVKPEDVSSVCARYFAPSNRTVGYLIPDGSAEDDAGEDENDYEST
jgi:predicted Zn-dependent peptidase